MTPIAVTIAGSDSGGGAGIQADLKTFGALGIYGASVVTALTAQNTIGVQAIHDVPAAFVAAQIDSVFSDLAVAAVKIGMLSRPDTIAAVAAGLERHHARDIVLDPVMIATSGDRLIAEDTGAALRKVLIPLALVITPNLHEAASLLGSPIARDEDEMAAQAQRLMALGPRAVLVKGGHLDGPESVDILFDGAQERRFASPRLATRNTHGTGCTLSSAIAAGLAARMSLEEAVTAAKRYVSGAIAGADGLGVGRGRGPLDHFHRLRGCGSGRSTDHDL